MQYQILVAPCAGEERVSCRQGILLVHMYIAVAATSYINCAKRFAIATAGIKSKNNSTNYANKQTVDTRPSAEPLKRIKRYKKSTVINKHEIMLHARTLIIELFLYPHSEVRNEGLQDN